MNSSLEPSKLSNELLIQIFQCNVPLLNVIRRQTTRHPTLQLHVYAETSKVYWAILCYIKSETKN